MCSVSAPEAEHEAVRVPSTTEQFTQLTAELGSYSCMILQIRVCKCVSYHRNTVMSTLLSRFRSACYMRSHVYGFSHVVLASTALPLLAHGHGGEFQRLNVKLGAAFVVAAAPLVRFMCGALAGRKTCSIHGRVLSETC